MSYHIDQLREDLEEAECTLEELNECGDLEERLEMAQTVEDIRAELFRCLLIETGSA